MPDGLMARLWAGLLATSPLEALAVLSSLVYVVLAVPRSRWCWVAGGVGSLIYVWLFARARLPMQSLLQVWYVGVAVFGFVRWSHEGRTRISLLSWRGHVAGIAASLLLAVAIARFLETQAAWPTWMRRPWC
jgi:nicotinamide mononucleotide transporter